MLHVKKLQILFSGTIAVMVLFSGPAYSSSQKDLMKKQQKIQTLKKKYKSVYSELAEIQQKCLKNNPELGEKQKQVNTLIKKKSDQYLSELNVDINRLQELHQKLQKTSDMKKQSKKGMIAEYKELLAKFQKAQKKTMTHPKVKRKREEFQNEMISAMKKENPKVKEMAEELNRIQKKIQQTQQTMRKEFQQ
jgi:septal ring factor EnvC (AmiA/AmiB activator)